MMDQEKVDSMNENSSTVKIESIDETSVEIENDSDITEMKDLKSEFQSMLSDETPDLWGRIQAQLGDNSKGAEIPESLETYIKKEDVKISEITLGDESESIASLEFNAVYNRGMHMAGKTKFYRYFRVAAACVCAAIILPVCIAANNHAKKAEMASEQAVAEAASDTATAAFPALAEGASAPAYYEEALEEEMEAFETDEHVENAMESAGVVMESSAKADVKPVSDSDMKAESSEINESAKAAKSEEAYEGIEEMLLVNVTITSKSNNFGEMVYTAIVSGNVVGTDINDGDVIMITIDDKTPETYKDGLELGSYELLLEIGEADGVEMFFIR